MGKWAKDLYNYWSFSFHEMVFNNFIHRSVYTFSYLLASIPLEIEYTTYRERDREKKKFRTCITGDIVQSSHFRENHTQGSEQQPDCTINQHLLRQ